MCIRDSLANTPHAWNCRGHAETASPQVADETVPQEHGPVAVSFDELMPKTLATATVDRLLHHAHVAQTSGESVRLSQALAGDGVTPLGGTR